MPTPVERSLVQDWEVLRPAGELDLHLGEEILREVASLCDAGSSRIVLDLQDVTRANASGTGALFTALRLARARGGDLRLAGARGELRSSLRVRKAHRIFRMHDSVHEAIAAGSPAARRLRMTRRG